MDLVRRIYMRFPNTVTSYFDANSPRTAESPSTVVKSSMESFTVLRECPALLAVIGNQQNMTNMISLLVDAFCSPLPSQAIAIKDNLRPVPMRKALLELISSKVKLLGFLVTLLRTNAASLRQYQKRMPEAIVQLLTYCPHADITTRKELLQNTRYVISVQDLKADFQKYIPTFLDEKAVVGDAQHSENRALAYGLIAELVHLFRVDMSPPDMAKAVCIFSLNLHDMSLALSTQSTSARLLMHLVEGVYSNCNNASDSVSSSSRQLLIRIFDTFVRKFRAIAKYAAILEDIKNMGESCKDVDVGVKLLPFRSSLVKDSQFDVAAEIKTAISLFRGSLLAVRTVMWSVSSQKKRLREKCKDLPEFLTEHGLLVEQEAKYCRSLLKHGIQCFKLSRGTSEERDLLDVFASVFAVLDTQCFMDVFCEHIDLLFNAIVENDLMICIPQHYLAGKLSKTFLEVLMSFLVPRLRAMGEDNPAAGVMHRMFKISIGSVTLFPDNESILRHHVQTIALGCLKSAQDEQRPHHFLSVFKALFRSVVSGKNLDVLHKEFIPIAKTLLDGFHKMLQNPSFEAHRDTIVDLCLSIPVRITYFLSHMYYQTKPVIMALNGNPETVAAGLKKLESWIDSLPSTFIHSILQPIASDLMKALHKQLALPSHHNLSLTTVRILGKLGGGNRQLISDFLLSESVPEKSNDVSFLLKWTLSDKGDAASLPVSLTQFAIVALDTIKTSKDATLRNAVLTFCKCSIPVLLQSIYKTMFQELKAFTEPGVKLEKDDHPSSISQCLKKTCNEMQRFSSVSVSMNEGCKPSHIVAALESWYDALRMISLAVVIGSQDTSSGFVELLDKLANALSRHATQSFEDQSKISFPQFYLPHWKFTCACVIDAISTDSKTTSEAGVVLLRNFVRMLNDSPPATHIPIANEMVRSCCQLGFEREHWKKIAFCNGIRVILEEVSVECVRPLENSIIRAIFFLWKDSQTEEIVSCTEAARTTFVELLTKCYFSSSGDKMEVGGENSVDASFQGIIDQMFVELHSASQNVRRNVQSMLKLVATRLNKDLSELLIPFKNHLFKAIPPTKLKQATMPTQLGFIDSLVFILTLPTPVISTVDSDLCACLEDAYQIAEMDDSYLLKQNDPRQIMQLQALRTSCVELLCAAMCSPHLNLCDNLTDLRDRVILLFFKVLSKGPKDALAFAKTGLSYVLNFSSPNDPKRGNFKELLQNSLRPVLNKLSDYKKLSVQLLEGLARLLELLAHCFNNTLGDKLIEYLRMWLDPEHVACFSHSAMGKPAKPGEELKIAVAITKIFHFLPPSPERFLQPLVDLTLKLEMQIPENVSFSYIRSPYREPLCMFLNKYAELSCEFFMPKFSDRNYFRLFLSCIKMRIASSLREALVMRMETLISSASLSGRSDENSAYNFVCMVAVFIEYEPAFLVNNAACLKEILRLWAERKIVKDEGPEMPLQVISHTQKLIFCLTSYVRSLPSDKSVLYQLFTAFTGRSVVDLTTAKHFLVHDFACGSSIEVKKAFLSHFIDSFVETPSGTVNNTISQDLKSQILIFIVSPMLSTTLQVPALRDQLMDPDTCKLFVKTILEPSEATLNSYSESLRVELLQLATHLIRFMAQGLVSLRKELIKFAWDHLKRDESICKQWAYVNVCYFIQQYEAPHKIIIQVYVALLRLFNQEVKVLQKVALDVLTPMLPVRLSAGEGRMPHWIKFTRKIVGDESQNPAHLIQIWQFMVRHPKLFYPYRHMFINNMGSSISKLGSPQPQSMDQKKVAIDLIELIFDWEQIRIQGGDLHSDTPAVPALTQEEIGSRRSRDEDFANMDIGEPGISRRRTDDGVPSSDNVPSTQSSVSGNSGVENFHAFAPCQQLVDIIMNFLLRFTVMYSVEPQNQQQTNRSLQQLIRGLSVWKNRQINIKLHYMERLISTADQSVHLQSAVDVVSHLWKHPFIGPSLVCDTGLKVLAKIVQVSAACDSLPVVSSLCDLVKKVLPHCTDVEAANAFQSSIGAFITAGLEHADRVRVLNALFLLKAISSSDITRIDPYCSTISRLLKKYTQEHMSDLFNYSQRRTDNAADQILAEQLSHLLILLIELLSSRITVLGEHRKYLLNSIVMLIERSSEVPVLKAIINILKEWVKDPVATGVTAKECSTLVIKMAPLEQMRDPSPFDAFLQMIMNIHGEGSVCDSTVKQKTEKCFTFGLKSTDPALQRQFFQHLSSRAPRHAFGRLKYILGEQEWDGVGDIFWLQHASELMLAVADHSAPLIPLGSQVEESVASLLGDLTAGDLIPALSILVHRSPLCARRFWLDIFPNFWRMFSSEEQTALATPLCALLVHDHPPKQQQRRPNVVQVLLESAEMCEPRPRISVQYLRYVGKTYNAWHAVLPVLEELSEHQTHSGMGDMMGDGVEKISEIHSALEELYEALEETDCLHALHRKRCKNPETLYGLSCVQFSFWQKAQDVFHQQMCKGFALPTAPEEQALLDSFWVQCCRHLNQWDILHEFSRKVRNNDLMLESSWKQQDWTALRDNLGNPNQADPQQTKIFEVYSALQENNTQDASKHCMEASQYALKRWIGLSGISAHAYVPLLQKFHTFVELEESCSILDEVQKAIRVNPPSNHVPDIKPIISAWRERLPNVWDDLTVWSDIIRMRVNVFRSLADCQSANNELKQVLNTLCSTEIFENTIKFCDAARKHRFLDVTLAALAKIPAPKSSDLNQTFQLQRQEFKCRFRMSAAERASSLMRLHRMDLDKFSSAQRAELLYLKGKFQAKEISVAAAQESFGTAVSMLESTAKYWVAWGNTFDQQLKASGPAGGSVHSEQGARCAENFVRCILRAIRLQPESAKLHLSRVLFLLQSEPPSPVVLDAFSSGAEACPSWVWLFLLPQILRIVEGPSRSAVIKILTKVSVDYPQAVFLQIRKLLKSLLPVRQPASAPGAVVKTENPVNLAGAAASGHSTAESAFASSMEASAAQTGAEPVELDAQQIIMKVWSALQDHHKSIVKESEIFVNEIIRLRPSSEMNLASTMWTWLDEVGRHDMRNPYPLEMLRSYCENLLEMCNTANCAPEIASERARFAAEFGPALNEDFGRSSLMYAASADKAAIGKDVYRVLGKWCGALEKYWAMKDPRIYLESFAPSLLEFKGSQMEFVGQYETLSEPSPDSHFKLDRILPRAQYVVRHGNCCFRLLLRGSDGRIRPYLVMNVRAMTTDDRWQQYRHIVNNALLQSRQSRARYLSVHNVTSVLITSRLRIVADFERPVNLGQVLRKSLAHTAPPAIALRHIEELMSSGSVTAAYQAVSLVVPPTLLRDHVAKLVGSVSQLWMLRRAFASHYGLNLIFAYSLCTTPAHADRITFSLDSGHMFYQDIRPSFDSKFCLKSKYPIPFRLTPNIVTFLQPVSLARWAPFFFVFVFIMRCSRCMSPRS